MEDDTALAALVRALATLEPLGAERVRLPRSEIALEITRPVDLDTLLDRAADDPEQHLPYWAEIWPSGLALADAILAEPDRVRGRRVLEIGCGLGVTAAAALRAGAELLAADYAPESLLLCRYNARRNSEREPATLRFNWRDPATMPPDVTGAPFPIVLAADVLYEARDVDPLLTLIERIVAPDGYLWLAEPRRPPARRFLDAALTAGWTTRSTEHPGPWPDPKDREVIVELHLLHRAAPVK